MRSTWTRLKMQSKWLLRSLVCLCLLALPFPSKKPADPSAPVALTLVDEGIASFYGRGFHGRLTASGTRFSRHAMTAASKTLPFGKLVTVVNLRNNRAVVVKITDRGPFVKGRILDLSEAAAREIGLVAGLASVAIYERKSNALDD